MPIELMIMAKAPEPNEVKTRLIGPLTPEQAAALQAAFIEDTVASCLTTASLLASSVDPLTPARRMRVRLACAPDSRHPFFLRLSARIAVQTLDQGAGELGERMQRLQQRAFELGALAVIFIGTDALSMPPKTLQTALQLLDHASVVLGPAEDGGYYLLGSARPTPELFEDVLWGTSVVLETTRDRLQNSDTSWRELDTHWDVDRPEDLDRLKRLLKREPERAPRTARLLEEFASQ